MHVIEVIGNIGADAELVNNPQGEPFVSFRVAVNVKYQGQDRTIWYECISNNTQAKVNEFLVKGQMVFVRGYPTYRIFDSAKYHCKMIGITISTREIQLVGSAPKNPSDAGEESPATPSNGEAETESTGEPVQVY